MTVTCLEGGTRHSWVSTGLDIVGDDLRYTRRCVWCPTEQTSPLAGYPGRWTTVRKVEP